MIKIQSFKSIEDLQFQRHIFTSHKGFSFHTAPHKPLTDSLQKRGDAMAFLALLETLHFNPTK